MKYNMDLPLRFFRVGTHIDNGEEDRSDRFSTYQFAGGVWGGGLAKRV